MSKKDSSIYIYDNRVLHLSHYPDIDEHRLGAAAFVVALEEKPLSILETETSDWRECRTALIPPGCAHETRFNGTYAAILHIEPESIDYMNISASMPNGDFQIMYDHIDEGTVIEQLRRTMLEKVETEDAYKITQSIIYGKGYNYEDEEKLDPRILKIVELIKSEPASSYSMEALAEMINLSATRFIHLFKEQTGVPIRRFRQWVRMKKVIVLVADGKSLTDAALEAGFTDSAHFSRAFKNMFGITPSSLFNKSQTTHYYISSH